MNKQIFFGWQQIPNSLISDILSETFEGVVLDTEHSMWSPETLLSCIQIVTSKEKVCLVRIHKRDLMSISKILDSGASGIILSTVETQQEAEDFVNLSYYYSQGGKRGLGLVRQNFWGKKGNLCSDVPILIPQIESINSIESLEKIVREEFKYYMIGPYDLSASLGSSGNFETQEFKEAIEKFNSLVPSSSRAVHIPNNVSQYVNKYKNYGIIMLGMDTTSLLEVNKRNLDEFRSINFHTDKE